MGRILDAPTTKKMPRTRPAGQYRTLITVQSIGTATDANGQQLPQTPATYCPLKGHIEQVNAQEIFKNHRVKNDITHVVYTRSTTLSRGISPASMQLLINQTGAILSIDGVYDDEFNRTEVQIHCIQRT